MRTEMVTLTTSFGSHLAELIFIDRHGHGVQRPSGLGFLHRVRHLPTPLWNHDEEEAFYTTRVLASAPGLLAAQLKGRKFDAVIAPPSNRNDAQPYLSAVQQAIGPLDDWSSCFTRKPGASAGKNPSWQDLARDLSFHPKPGLERLSLVLLVDDQFATGTTASAVLEHLIQAGAPRSLALVIAAPLRVMPSPKKKA